MLRSLPPEYDTFMTETTLLKYLLRAHDSRDGYGAGILL